MTKAKITIIPPDGTPFPLERRQEGKRSARYTVLDGGGMIHFKDRRQKSRRGSTWGIRGRKVDIRL